MKIVRNAVLRNDNKITIAMLITAIFMLLLSIVNISLDFAGDTPALAISIMNSWALPVSVIPITWGICTAMLMKTKKVMFSKFPAYIICCLVLIAMIILFIAAGDKYFVYKVMGFAVAVLLVYPFVIATLTIEGRMYNRVFATIFSGILLVLSLAGAIAICVILKSIMLSTLIPALVYVELILSVLCYNLEIPTKTSENRKNIITH